MKKSASKPETKKGDDLWCEYSCANCDIEAPERCSAKAFFWR